METDAKANPKIQKNREKILQTKSKLLKTKIVCREGLEYLLELQRKVLNGHSIK